MEVVTIATGSTGNSYIVGTNGNYVILDCGVRFQDITHHPKFPSFSKIDFVFCSHCHHDHDKSLKDFRKSGCEIVSYETLETKTQRHRIGDWEAMTFPVAHNVPCWGIILKHTITGEKLTYITDFFKAPMIENCPEFIFEVNYIDAFIDEMIDENKDLKHTNFTNHCSLEYAVEYFSKMKHKPKKILCCHLSREHSVKARVLQALKPFADEVIILEKGVVV